MAEFRKLVAPLLSQALVSDLSPALPALVEVDINATVEEGVRVLAAHNVLSAPVRREDGTHAGFLDLQQLVSFVLDVKKSGGDLSQSLRVALCDVDGSNPQQQQPGPAHALHALHANAVAPMRTTSTSATLLQACAGLRSGVRRLGVVDGDGKLVGVLSQSRIASALCDLLEQMGAQPFNTPVAEVGVCPSRVWLCKASQPLQDALELLHTHNISGVAIVDDNEQLVGQVCATRLLPVVQSGNMAQLDTPIAQVLGASCSVESGEAIAMAETATIGDMFRKFATSRSHRLFLVDDRRRVCGVCSFKDVLNALLG